MTSHRGNADHGNIESQVLIRLGQLDHAKSATVDQTCSTLDYGIRPFHSLHRYTRGIGDNDGLTHIETPEFARQFVTVFEVLLFILRRRHAS